MNGAIGDILPLAVTVAISPIPIIAVTLMLLSGRARANSITFLIGWTVGIALAATVFTLISSAIDRDPRGPSVVASIIKIALGVLLLIIAFLQWRKRPLDGSTPKMPRWMSAIDSITAPKAASFGLILSALNPKNLIMSVTAGVSIGTAGISGGLQVIAVAIFVVIAIATIAVPVLGYLLAAERMRTPLEHLRKWLTENNAVIMSVLLLIIGVVNIGKGIAAL